MGTGLCLNLDGVRTGVRLGVRVGEREGAGEDLYFGVRVCGDA